MSRQKGFSLIELLIVVAIILVIAAIAIPNLMRSRMAANESSAAATLHAVNTSELVYSTTFGLGYSSNLASLGGTCSISVAPDPAAACLLDPVLATDPAIKSGYTFTYANAGSGNGNGNGNGKKGGNPVASYTLVAAPIAPGSTGQRYFFTDESEVIRAEPAAAATASSSPI